MANKEITLITREATWYRPYNVNGKTVEKIVVYKDGEIIIKTRSGWFEETDENYHTKYLGDLIEISIDGPVKRANKLNLHRTDNFIFKMKDEYSIHEGYTLFIYADNIFSEYIELPKKYDKEYYLYGYSVTFKYPFKQYEMYLKYYNRDEKIEDQDKRSELRNCVVKDENGKPKKDENGKYILDPNKFYCSRTRLIETRKPVVIYNGLYIKEGK